MEAQLPQQTRSKRQPNRGGVFRQHQLNGKTIGGGDNSESTPNEDNQILEAEPLATNKTEEHEGGPPSSVSDINPRDFYNPSDF